MEFKHYIESCEMRLKDMESQRSSFKPDYDEGRRDMLTTIIGELKSIEVNPRSTVRKCLHLNTYHEGSLGEFCTNCNIPID